jgi:hypothetical protein
VIATSEACSACETLLELEHHVILPEFPEAGARSFEAIVMFCSRPGCNACTIVGQGRRVVGVRRAQTTAQILRDQKLRGTGRAGTATVTIIGGEVCSACMSFLDFPQARAYHTVDTPDVVLCPPPCAVMTEVGSGRRVSLFKDKRPGGEVISGAIRTPSAEFREAHEGSGGFRGIDFARLAVSRLAAMSRWP